MGGRDLGFGEHCALSRRPRGCRSARCGHRSRPPGRRAVSHHRSAALHDDGNQALELCAEIKPRVIVPSTTRVGSTSGKGAKRWSANSPMGRQTSSGASAGSPSAKQWRCSDDSLHARRSRQGLRASAAADGCEKCLESDDPWLHLRICLECGAIGCCDDSPNAHATSHAKETGHLLIRSLEPGDEWSCCFEDEAFLLLPHVKGHTEIPPSPLGG